MFRKVSFWFFLSVLIIYRLSIAQEINEAEFSKLLKGNETAFILYDHNNEKVYRYNHEICSTRFRPASTFKILNSLIGLETGAVKSENDTIKWNGYIRVDTMLNRDHTLKSAIKYSVVWYFQEVARRIGLEKMQEYLNKVNYGNMTIGKKIDGFWLDGNLKISADEQFNFLKIFYDNNVPFSQQNINTVKDMITLESTENYILRGKTGTGLVRGKGYISWFIGYIETNENAYIFVMNNQSVNPDKSRE